jgi:DNA-binding transcriptional LysR family regulator
MEKELIETFLVVSKVQNVSKASRLLFVSQATVSYRLKLLEKKLNTTLIQRSKGSRQTVLTTNGKRFLPLAQAWMNTDTALENFASHKDTLDLKVGSTNSINNFLLRDFFLQLGSDTRKWNINIQTTHTPTIYEELQLNDIDVGMCLQERLTKKINIKLIYSEPLLILSAKPIHHKKILTPMDLNMEKMIYINAGYSFNKWYQRYVPEGVTPTYTVDSYQFAWSLMKKDYWFFAPVCFLMEQKAKGESCAVACLGGTNPTYDVYLATEGENEKLRRYEITLFKRRLTQYLHQKHHAVQILLSELFPQKENW